MTHVYIGVCTESPPHETLYVFDFDSGLGSNLVQVFDIDCIDVGVRYSPGSKVNDHTKGMAPSLLMGTVPI